MNKLGLTPGAPARKLPIFDEKLMGEVSAEFKEAKASV